MNQKLSSLVVLAACCLSIGGVHAGSIEINNHSFELNEAATPFSNSDSATIIDWKKDRAFSAVQDAAFLATVPGAPAAWSDGKYGLAFIGGFAGYIQQETETNIVPNTTYTVQVDIAGVDNWQGFKVAVGVGDVFLETGAQATKKGEVPAHSLNYNFATKSTDLVPGSFSTDLSNVDATEGQWSTLTITFKTAATTTGASPLTIRLQTGNHSPGGKDNGGYLLMDNVRVTTAP